jgi:hypothetical protein
MTKDVGGPDELRKLANERPSVTFGDRGRFIDGELYTAADAWEHERVHSQFMVGTLEDRIEELERRETELTRQWELQRQELIRLRARIEEARWLVEMAPHCYGSMTREWETRREVWLAALAGKE